MIANVVYTKQIKYKCDFRQNYNEKCNPKLNFVYLLQYDCLSNFYSINQYVDGLNLSVMRKIAVI